MTLIPATLIDPVPGNRGLRGPGVLLLAFDQPDGVLTPDLEGNLDNLAPVAGHTVAPTAATGWTGLSRSFTAASVQALIASDLPGELTLLQRDVTIQVLLALELGSGAQPTSTMIARGNHDGTESNAWSYGLELFDGGGGLVGVRWFWDAGLATKTDGGATFQPPPDGEIFMLTATRRWTSSTSVTMRYYVDERLIAETTSAFGAIDGGTTGKTTVGARLNNTTWEHFLTATIDQIYVGAFEMSLEEIRHIWRRLSLYQPQGVAMLTGLVPPGSGWGSDPGNRIGKWSKVAGQALGQGIAGAEELRALWLPDAVTLATIGRWETLIGIAPGPTDSLDIRRARIISYLSRENGYAIPQVQQALSGVLGLAPSDVGVFEFSNEIDEGFLSINSQRWTVGGAGTWAIVGFKLRVTEASGGDISWAVSRTRCNLRAPMADSPVDFFAALEVAAYTLPINTLAGLYFTNGVSGNSLWFGVYNDGSGAKHFGYITCLAGIMGTFTVLGAAPAAPVWLRVQNTADGMFTLSHSATDSTTATMTSHIVAIAFDDFQWAGPGAVSTDTALASGLSVDFTGFTLYTPNGDRPFYWYVFRDPSDPGSWDALGGEATVLKVKPAHTYAGLCFNAEILCDDPRDGLCDRGPLGAL